MNDRSVTPDAHTADRFRHLALRHLEGLLTADEFAQFDRLLAEHSACRMELLSFALQARLIATHLATLPQLAPQSIALPAASLPVRSFRHATATFGLPAVCSMIGCAVIFAGYFIAISWNMLGRQADRVRGLATSGIDAVAMIAASEDAKWAADPESLGSQSGASAKSEVAQGELLRLASGLVELQLKQGATLLVEGPADWSIDGDNNATLTRGKLLAKVPQPAIGFTLNTPTATIVDLGTEFGADVGQDGQTTVHVLEGEVECRRSKSEDKAHRLTAGEARRIVRKPSGKVVLATVPFEPPSISIKDRRPLEERWREARQKLLKDPGLVAYYDFEDEGQVVRNKLADRLHGEVITDREQGSWSTGRFHKKRAIALGKDFASVSIPDDRALHPSGNWSIALWLRVDALPASRTYVQILGKGQFPQRSYSLWLDPGLLSLSANGTGGAHFLCGAPHANLVNHWHHVVAVRDATKVRLYMNGVEVSAVGAPTGSHVTNTEPLVLGCSTEASRPHRFTGAIDELSIFARALVPSEVRAMYETGKPSR